MSDKYDLAVRSTDEIAAAGDSYTLHNVVMIDANGVPVKDSVANFVSKSGSVAASLSAAGLPNPATADTYLKRNSGNTAYEAKTADEVATDVLANISATEFLSAMPAGTVVQKVVTAVGSDFSTTNYGANFATVITQSFTPKFASSKIIVTLCGRNNYAHRDYGSAVADGDVRLYMRIKDGTTTPLAVTGGGIMASTCSDGDIYAWFPGFMPQQFDAGSTNARTYTAEACAAYNETDVAILAPYLIIEEIKQ